MSSEVADASAGADRSDWAIQVWLWLLFASVFAMVWIGGITRLTGSGLRIESVIDGEANPQEAVERDQERDILRDAIETLPERCREIFILRKINDMSQSEIAKK